LSTRCEWLAPETIDGALAVRAERGEEATILAGGTFLGILINQRLFAPSCLLGIGRIPGLDGIEVVDGELRLGAMARHRAVERAQLVREGWPALAHAFSVVASPRVRNQATVGGVLADADYASDPPAMLCALGARAVARSVRGEREIPVDELITGYYETSLAPDELLTEVVVPPADAAVYRKFRSRSHEDRPCVSVAAVRVHDRRSVVVGAVAARPQVFPELCSNDPAEVGRAYAEAIEPISDVRGSAAYRRRVIAVEVRRALEELAST
jgi:aerobic carbon-monoxide dehydrogenase medium subunit